MISKVAVIGSGTMGSGIAGQLANANIDVLLLDIKSSGDRPNAVAEHAIERLQKSDPPLIVHPDVLKKITVGNIDDDIDKIGDCDWIVEAIVERLELKCDLYETIDRVSKPDAIVSSNTSTIPMSLLTRDLPISFRKRFAITHFFNPVRYMRLLELVSSDDTDPAVMATLRSFNDEKMGKGIVDCRDTPGFLANRVGVFALQVGIDEAIRCGISIEYADALMGRPMGIPKTGVFGLYDLIGLDLMVDVVKSLKTILPEGDAFHPVSDENALITRLIGDGYTGLKGRGGFYRNKDGRREAIDLQTGQWRNAESTQLALAELGEADGIGVLIQGDTAGHRFCRRVLARVLSYAAGLIPEVADGPVPIDDAMKLGYNWVQGPFELIDEIGVEQFIRLLQEESIPVPRYLAQANDLPCYRVVNHTLESRDVHGFTPLNRPAGVVRFNETRRTLTPLSENSSASLFRLDGNVALVEFHTKANALDSESMAIVAEAAGRAAEFGGILVHNDGPHFCAGVNLNHFRRLIEAEDWAGIDTFLVGFQDAVKALKYCPVPVVAACSGLAIGGGYEVVAHCDRLVAHTNIVLGLVESMVGVLPGGGGIKDTLQRWTTALGDPERAAQKTFMNIGYGKTASSPLQASNLLYFRDEIDQQVMNRDRLVEAGLHAISDIADGYTPPPAPTFTWVGAPTFHNMCQFLEEALHKGNLTAHDVVVGTELARVVTGGDIEPRHDVTEDELFAAERQAFVNLAKTAATHARIVHMLDGGGALRN